MCSVCGLISTTGCQVNCGTNLAQNINTALVATSPFLGGAIFVVKNKFKKQKPVKKNEKK